MAAALPTLALAAWRPGLIVDDWAMAVKARQGFSTFGEEIRWRPGQGLWHAAEFLVFGTSPVPHLVVLAVLNGVAAALLWACAARYLSRRRALLVAAAWVALANRGSTRLWPATAPNQVALILVLAGLMLVTGRSPDERRRVAAAVLAATAVLTYEGVAGLALVVVATAGIRRRRSDRPAVVAIVPGVVVLGLALAWMAAHTRREASTSLADPSRWVAAHLGVGVWPRPFLVFGLAIAIVVCVSAARLVLPSFKAGTGPDERVMLAGVALFALGAGPFLLTGFPVATDGIFDRGSLFADVGTATVLAGVLGLLWRGLPHRAAMTIAVLVLAVAAAQQHLDVWSFHRAATDGRRLLAAVDRLPAHARMEGPLVLAPLPNRNGVVMFAEDYDLRAALALRYGTLPAQPSARMAFDDDDLCRAPAGSAYRLHGDRLVRVDPDSACEAMHQSTAGRS